jgi:hypothetical protein
MAPTADWIELMAWSQHPLGPNWSLVPWSYLPEGVGQYIKMDSGDFTAEEPLASLATMPQSPSQ